MRNTLAHPTMIHPHTGRPLEALGRRRDGRPIWPILGASEDDDEDEGDDGDDTGVGDDEDEDEDDDPWAGKTDVELKAELSRVTKSSTRASSQAKAWREFAQGKTDKAPDGRTRTKPKTGDEDDESKTTKTAKGGFTKADLEAARQEAIDAAREENQAAAISVSARA
jgi:hypothetical protein